MAHNVPPVICDAPTELAEERGGSGEPQPAPVPAKRGRGRPPKNKVAPPKTSPDPDQPKRGRGRPRKVPEAPKVDSDAPKRGRGRPRKKPLEPARVDGDTPKRGRGRPRKNPLPEPPSSEAPPVEKQLPVESQESSSPARPLPDPAAPTRPPGSAEGAAVKRKRGRPRKIPAESNQPPTPAAKRKRGRPRKRPLDAPSNDSADPPIKKRRGRPPKEKPASGSIAAGGNKAADSSQSEDGSREFHLHVSFEDSSSDQELAGTNIATLVARNGVLEDKQADNHESSDTSYSTPEPPPHP